MGNMKKKLYFLLCLISCSLFTNTALAQTNTPTHAESKSKIWKGIDVETVLGNSTYSTTGRKIYLYNVGTGRFIIEGGEWGMEGRLFHETFGRQMFLRSDGFILSGITENNSSNKIMFGCNVPGVSKNNAKWSQANQYCFYMLMDADQTTLKKWNFQRVNSDPDNYTYYMWETMTNRQNDLNPEQMGTHDYYLGAAYGERHYGNKDGMLIYLDYDRSCWTTASVIGNQDMVDVNGEMISIDKLYQWRLVSEEEFLEELRSTKVGLNPSISCLVPDRDFTRNSDNFDSYWLMQENTDADYSQTGRRGFTYGKYLNNKTQKECNNNSEYFINDAWNKPIRLKETFDVLSEAKYGYLFFEGVGRTYTEIEVPNPGWYLVECYGFLQTAGDYDAYLFAKVKGSTEMNVEGGESRNHLVKVASNTYKNKNGKAGCLAVGKLLTDPNTKDPYKNLVWICVTEEEFSSGNNILQIGVGKDYATRSNATTSGGVSYYYDTDWVCVDDFRVSYMGLGPVFFYEDEEDLEYLRFDQQDIKQYPSATPNGHYSGAANLERSFKKDQWNTFSFPIPLTGEQMRFAFGDNAVLAKLNSIGLLSKHSNVIDFESVNLFTTENVVTPGEFYLLKPTADPVKGIDPRGLEKEYYELGRNFFSVNGEEESSSYEYPKMSLSTLEESKSISSWNDENDGMSYANYVQTPDFDNFTVSGGVYTGSVANGLYAPKGSYAVSNNTIYHLSKDTRIKGFRGWITVEQPIQAKEMTMFVDGISTSVVLEDLSDALSLTDDTSVFDLSGRKVGTLGTNLPKGLYIVSGKKMFVK